MSAPVILIGVGVGLAVMLLALVLVSRMRADAGAAIGKVSKDTVKKDQEGRKRDEESDKPSGREVERQAKLDPSGELVAAEPAPQLESFTPPDPEIIEQTRRQFLNRGIVTFMTLGLAGFGVATMVQFLWPLPQKGFGGKITAGNKDDILSQISTTKQPFYSADGRFYIQPYPTDAVAKADVVYSPAVIPSLEAGFITLYQKCPHLGCRVPWCSSSQWFECPCHGSQYNRVGEKKGGPAPAGMFQFPASVGGDGTIVVDTGSVIIGVPIGTNTTGQEAEGPHCI